MMEKSSPNLLFYVNELKTYRGLHHGQFSWFESLKTLNGCLVSISHYSIHREQSQL
jgi:hypothetical protein